MCLIILDKLVDISINYIIKFKYFYKGRNILIFL